MVAGVCSKLSKWGAVRLSVHPVTLYKCQGKTEARRVAVVEQ